MAEYKNNVNTNFKQNSSFLVLLENDIILETSGGFRTISIFEKREVKKINVK